MEVVGQSLIGGRGEASPNAQQLQTEGCFVSSVLACAQCYSLSPYLVPFALEGFPFPSGFINLYTSLSESQRIHVDLNGLVSRSESAKL